MFRKTIHFLLTFLIIGKSAFAGSPESFADLVEKLMPAVVNISTTQKIVATNSAHNLLREETLLNELFEKFMPPMIEENIERRGTSLGSGFIIDSAGYIATNYHVIADAEEITVKFNNDKQAKAKIIGFDNKTDLALLKIDVDYPLPYVSFADSEKVRAGDWVIAIGNPFGLGGTVTAGIVSSRSRDINLGGSLIDNFIQTDAAINRGNSGGPMFNTEGGVIGINSVILAPGSDSLFSSSSAGNIGIGFAVPSSLAQKIFAQLKNSGKVKRGWLGVKIQVIDEEVADSLGLSSTKGALISEVVSGSPAEKFGIKSGDIVISYDEKEINSVKQLSRIVAESEPGAKIPVKLVRKGKEHQVTVIIAELEEANISEGSSANSISNNSGIKEINGVSLVALNKENREKYAIDKKIEGLLVLRVNKKSTWARKGIARGDIIVSVNQISPLTSLEELENSLDKAKKSGKKSVLLMINRDNQFIFLTVPVI